MISLRQDIFADDALKIADWLDDEDILVYLNEDKNISKSIRSLVQISNMPIYNQVFNKKGNFYLIYLKEDPIGFVKFIPKKDSHEIVITIGEKNLWGNGYGKKALKKALCEAFLSNRYSRINAKIKALNSRSLAMFEHLGFDMELERNDTIHLSMDFKTFLKKAA